MKEYEVTDGPEFSTAAWTRAKSNIGCAFPNLPYFQNGDTKITETLAIHRYIADNWAPELLGRDA